MPVGLRWGCFTGERGKPRPCRGWKSLRAWAIVCVRVCARPTLLWAPLCVCVCVAYSHCEQKAQVRDTEREDMHDLLTALWCVPPKKRSYVTETSAELM